MVADTPSLEIEGMPASVEAGESVRVDATLEAGASEVELELRVDGETVASEQLEPSEAGTETVELEWETGPDAVGEHEVAVTGAGESVTGSVTVEEKPAAFGVSFEMADEHVSPDGIATVLAAIENEGTLEGTEQVSFLVDGETEATEQVTLAGQATTTLEFAHRASGETATITLAVEAENERAETSVEVVTGSVTSLRKLKSKGGMGPFGWLMLLGMAILLVPLLPFILLIKLVDVVFGQGGVVR